MFICNQLLSKGARLAMKNVTGTAFIVAEFRAEENEEAMPLYTDNVVKIWLNEETKKVASHIAQSSPAAKEMVKLRTNILMMFCQIKF